jgi:hypothetical protein
MAHGWYLTSSPVIELAGSTGSAVDRPDWRRFRSDIQNLRPAGERKYSRLLQRRSSNRRAELAIAR